MVDLERIELSYNDYQSFALPLSYRSLKMVGMVRLELTTYRLKGGYANQLRHIPEVSLHFKFGCGTWNRTKLDTG